MLRAIMEIRAHSSSLPAMPRRAIWGHQFSDVLEKTIRPSTLFSRKTSVGRSKGRDFGAWLGLVPKQMSTGGRTILGPISKRGNRYLRMLFVQAARTVLLRPQSWEKHGLKLWIEAAARRLNRFKLAIALANKIARIAWAVLHGGRNFEVRPMNQTA